MANIDQLQQRISFFENSTELREKIAKSENDRLQLEIELNRMINSDEAIAKAKAVRLKNYYTKLCQDEEKALKRNQRLLGDLQRIDNTFAQLESKLERLTNLKKECEVYLRTAYPVWTNENKILNSREPSVDLNYSRNSNQIGQISPNKSSDFLNQQLNQSGSVDNGALNALMHSFNLNQERTKRNEEIKETRNMLDNVNFSTNQPGSSTIKNLVFGPSQNEMLRNNNSNKDTGHHQSDNRQEEEYSLKKLASSIGPKHSNNYEDDMQPQYTTNLNTDNNLLKEYERELKRQDLNMLDSLGQTTSSLNRFVQQSSVDMNTNNLNNMNTWSSPLIRNLDELPKASSTSKDGQIFITSPKNNDDDLSESGRKGSFKGQELNLNSLYYLLDYIELEIRHTIHPERYYKQVEPHYKTKLEIIKLARENESLDEMDPADISMVILDQLPIVIRKRTKSRCLFTPDIMGLSVADINEQIVSKSLTDEQDRQLWSRLYKHFNYLKTYSSIDVYTMAHLFGPSLLGSNQNGSEKAVKFLEKILNSTGSSLVPAPMANLDNNESKSMTETSLNQELVAASSSKLKESSVYQDFIMNSTGNTNKSKQIKFVQNDYDDDENDEIDAMVAPKSLISTTSSVQPPKTKNATIINNPIIRSPRAPSAGDFDFDFSQSSTTTSQKVPTSVKQLNSLRSSTDKKQLPVYLRDPDSEDDSDNMSEVSNKFRQKSQKSENSDYDFYN